MVRNAQKMTDFITINDDARRINIVSIISLGSGNHWNVFSLSLETPYKFNGIEYSEVVCKIKKSNNADIHQNILEYKNVCKIGAPTLKFYHKGVLQQNGERKNVIITENINTEHISYVSPNSVKETNEIGDLLLKELTKKKSTEGISKETKVAPIEANNISNGIESIRQLVKKGNRIDGPVAEDRVLNNKIEKIRNLNELIDSAIVFAKKAGSFSISIYDDAYFFGVEQKSESSISFKIADFDSIVTVDELQKGDEDIIKDGNCRFALTAIYNFVKYFVSPSNSKVYQERVEKVCKQYADSF